MTGAITDYQLPGTDTGRKAADADDSSLVVRGEAATGRSPTTSMKHKPTRSADLLKESGRAAVKAGLPATTQSGDETADLVSKHLSPNTTVAMGGDQIRKIKFVFVHRETKESPKRVALVGEAGPVPAVLTANPARAC